jgi:glyoxylase-like metal-dependent hydrolase (beta-lactamase superfamily II)
VLLRTVEAPLLGSTCVVLVDDEARAVVVDAGGGVAEVVLGIVESEGWTPIAVLATHGHVDHTWDAGALCAAWDVPLHVHEADAYRLADPFGTLGPLGWQLAEASGLAMPVDPPRVVTHAVPAWTVQGLDLGLGTPVSALHLPGHTEGSTAYLVEVDGAPTMLTGDVLFAGTIGRTDLPGGDQRLMTRSLVCLAEQDPATVIVPGHGPRSTLADERATNPYLRAAR